MKPEISIVVPVYNGEKTLSSCLGSLIKLDYPKNHLEIVVIDNNSTDATKRIIRNFPVKYVFEPLRNRAAARNRGIKESQAKFIAFIDSDCIADKSWISYLLEGFVDNRVVGCGGKISYLPYNGVIGRYLIFRDFYNQEKALALNAKDFFLPWIMTANAVYRKDVLEKIGLFDDSLVASEDVDLSWRICLKGYGLRYVPKAIVYLKPWETIFDISDVFFYAGYAKVHLYKKYNKQVKVLSPIHRIEWLESASNLKLIFRSLIKVYNPERIFSLFDVLSELASALGKIYCLIRLKLHRQEIRFVSETPRNILWQKTDNELVIIKLRSEQNYILEGVGRKIWELFMQVRDTEYIIKEILDEYEIDEETVRKDLNYFLNEIEKAGLFNFKGEPGLESLDYMRSYVLKS